jgi:hypothetical protein
MRRDRGSVFVPDKTKDTEAKRSIISSEVVSLNEPLWLVPSFINAETVALEIFGKHRWRATHLGSIGATNWLRHNHV